MIRCTSALLCLCTVAIAHDGHGKKHAPDSAKALRSPLTAAQARPELGKAAYERGCAACHDADGTARTKAKLKPAPTSLTNPRMDSMKDGEIYWVVTHGIAKTMPAFETQLSEAERWQVVHYVRWLRARQKEGAHAKH